MNTKKNIAFIFLLAILVAAGYLVFTENNRSSRSFDERISLSPGDRRPYGTFIAHDQLKTLKPDARILRNTSEPYDAIYDLPVQGKKAFFIVTGYFYPDSDEMSALLDFVKEGNNVFISSQEFSYYALDLLDDDLTMREAPMFPILPFKEDTLVISLNSRVFGELAKFSFPGPANSSFITGVNSTYSNPLGYVNSGLLNFVHFKPGAGNLYLHTTPVAFSNYFLLSRNNFRYYEQIVSLAADSAETIVWDEYFAKKGAGMQNSSSGSNSSLSVLFRYPALTWGFLTALLTLLVYVLIEMKRRQRMIPVVTKPRNESLDFAKTIGRLYYDKGDHANLARKMSSYFLEYIRTRYKLQTNMLNEEFIEKLHNRSGVEKEELRTILEFIKYADTGDQFSAKQLTAFHETLDKFYSKA